MGEEKLDVIIHRSLACFGNSSWFVPQKWGKSLTFSLTNHYNIEGALVGGS